MIERLHINHVRNIADANLCTKAVNVVVGANGSGKTSLLEAIFLLSRGKSFRHHEPKRYISHTQPSCTVWARLDDGISTLAIQKSLDATSVIRHNQLNVASQSELTRLMPTVLIDPSSMIMLEDGASSRRALLDWLVFHVKSEFLPTWQGYNRLLKQRNQLIKIKPHARQEIVAWDAMLSDHAFRLHELRATVFAAWQTDFASSVCALLPEYAKVLSIDYQAGFDTSAPLLTTLQARLDQDISAGYTRIGAHRADLVISYKDDATKDLAVNVLSRGEKKLLITALKISQIVTLCCLVPQAMPIVLIDDLDAELDEQAVWALLQVLVKLPCQLFVTSLDARLVEVLSEIYAQAPSAEDSNSVALPIQVFHVEQGNVREHQSAMPKASL